PRMDDTVDFGFGYGHRLARRTGHIATGAPAPRDELVLGQMLDDLGEALVAVSAPVQDLAADFARGLVLPRHRKRREVPVRRARDAARRKILRLMARRAMHAG